MGEIQKGIILTLEGEPDKNGNPTKAKVQATSAEGTSTLPIAIPWYLRGKMGNLQKGTEIVFAVFDDTTGIVLSRMDGSWDGTLEDDIKAKGTLAIEKTARIGSNLTVGGNINLGGEIV